LYLIVKIKKVEKKLVNVSYEDVKLITESLKDLIVESEKVSDRLENSIKEKEGVLEDLIALIDDKLKRLEDIDETRHFKGSEVNDILDIKSSGDMNIRDVNLTGMSLKEKVIYLSRSGSSPAEIAKKLGISVTEVSLVLKHGR
jgi:DNA-binding transcriptional regulator GbsR (MarR family)